MYLNWPNPGASYYCWAKLMRNLQVWQMYCCRTSVCVCVCPSVEMMGHPELCSECDIHQLEPLLPREVVDDLLSKYVKTFTVSYYQQLSGLSHSSYCACNIYLYSILCSLNSHVIKNCECCTTVGRLLEHPTAKKPTPHVLISVTCNVSISLKNDNMSQGTEIKSIPVSVWRSCL